MTKRVLAARFMHETNTFSVVKTDLTAFRRRDFHRDNEIPTAYRGTRSAFGATFEAADKYGWQLVHPISTAATPSGLVTTDAFDHVADLMVRAAKAQGPIDGGLRHLHGGRVTGDGYDPRLQASAEGFMDYAWETRDVSSIKLLSIADVIAVAGQGQPGDKPLVISDYTDNPGGGGYGDATALLKAMVEAKLPRAAFCAICDPEAVLAGQAAGVGRTATIRLGGKVDPSRGGGPLELTGEVAAITDGKFIAWGPMGGGTRRDQGLSMLLRIGGLDGIDIMVITNNAQATDLAQLMGVDPTRKLTLAVKSMHHFRAAFEPISREVLLVDSGSLCTE